MITPHRLSVLLYYLLAQFCAHRPHTHPQQCRRTKPLFRIASTWSSVVQAGEGTYCPLRTLPHSFEEQPFLIINRHTKRWAPNNTEQISLCAQVLNVSANHCVPSTTPSSFQIPAHKWKMWGTQKIFSTFLFSHSVKQAHFKAFICAKPLINSAHAASLSLPLLKYWVL